MYFIALVAPGEINTQVLKWKHFMKEHFGCSVALRSPAHITLLPPFWLEDTKEIELQQILGSFTSDIAELEIQLDGFSHFGNRVLFVKVRENLALEQLRNQTENHFIQSFTDVIKKENRPFHPHITIANRDLKPGGFEKAWEHFSKKEFKEAFRAKKISLLKLNAGTWDVINEKNW